ncbi:MAG: ribokinase, partial [Carbonactinosporaceae bacterium]
MTARAEQRRTTKDLPGIFVVGSLNADLVVPVARHPGSGETVLGGDLTVHAGGKGANQAVAAARLGGSVGMLGRVGDDAYGALLLGSLAGAGVATAQIHVTPGVSTGVAMIPVRPDGENTIVVSPGANARVSEDDVDAAADVIAASRVVVAQLELPLPTVRRAARLAREAGGRFLLNAAPAAALDDGLLQDVDVLVVNEHEASLLLGRRVTQVMGVPEAQRAAEALRARGPCAVVVTLGAGGAVIDGGDEGDGARDGRAAHVPAIRVPVVDTTGAGDAFVGGLAVELAAGGALG